MQFDPVLIAPRLKAMTDAGFWRNQTINDFMAQALRDCPEKTAWWLTAATARRRIA